MDTPLRARKYEQWASDWSTYMQGKGIEPERFAFLRRRRADKRAGTPAHSPDRAGHQEGRTSLQNLERHPLPQPSRGPAGTQGPYARRACDIQCFNTQHYLQKTRETLAFKEQHSRDGLQWWTYTGGFSHQLTDPYVAWQLRFWLCFDLGLTGAHFWAFGDGNGGSEWDEYFNTGTSHSPLYLHPEFITTSKAVEAMREGAQDLKLLKMLEQQAGEKTVRKLRKDVKRALRIHAGETWLWKSPKDRSTADAVRIGVLESRAEFQPGG